MCTFPYIIYRFKNYLHLHYNMINFLSIPIITTTADSYMPSSTTKWADTYSFIKILINIPYRQFLIEMRVGYNHKLTESYCKFLVN